MKLLYGYVRGYWRLIAIALALAAISRASRLMDPIILQYIIDNYATRFQQYTMGEFFRGVGPLIGAGVGVACVSSAARAFQSYYVSVVTQRLGAQLYADAIGHSLALPYAVFEDQRSGETLDKVQRVRRDVERFVTALFNVVFPTLVTLTIVVSYASTVHWIFAPAFLLLVGLFGMAGSVLSRRIKKLQRAVNAEATALAGSATESFRNIELVKSLGLAEQETIRLQGTAATILALELKKVAYLRRMGFVRGVVMIVLRAGIIALMFYWIYAQLITVGQFFAFLMYTAVLITPLTSAGNFHTVYYETEASLEVFGEMMRTPRESKPVAPQPLQDLKTLTFEDVGFQYRTASSPAVSDVSFEVRRGETIAFVGPSGAGKTTLVKLLVGLYRPCSGQIRYDGVAGTDVDFDEVRERIGFITQETQLFAGTIRENLLFVNAKASDDECLDALRKAACESVLRRAPRGLDTVIGEGGVKLSGGERQRLSIARALLRHPSVLVFDEATSSLDSLTEDGIVETIQEVAFSGDTITILIAHRLSTVMCADRIYVLELGRIVETGRHEDLVERKGLYYAMWRQQIGERQGLNDRHARVGRRQPA